jgi:adenosylcobinamide-phosphate synthase
MIIASMILGMDSKNAYKIYKRDRYNHLSPNSAQTESVCAGALNISLGGGNYYGGILVSKQTIGDDDRPIEAEDIKKANNLMYLTSFICLILGIVIVILF